MKRIFIKQLNKNNRHTAYFPTVSWLHFRLVKVLDVINIFVSSSSLKQSDNLILLTQNIIVIFLFMCYYFFVV